MPSQRKLFDYVFLFAVFVWFVLNIDDVGNGQYAVSRVLFRKRELTEFCAKLGEFCEKLGEFALAHK